MSGLDEQVSMKIYEPNKTGLNLLSVYWACIDTEGHIICWLKQSDDTTFTTSHYDYSVIVSRREENWNEYSLNRINYVRSVSIRGTFDYFDKALISNIINTIRYLMCIDGWEYQ